MRNVNKYLNIYSSETIDAIEVLDLAPDHTEISDINDLFFAEGNSLGWSWSEKGVELFDKRTILLFKILLLCLTPKNIEEIQELIEFNSRNKLREMYINPLRGTGLLEYTIKDKPNSSNQKYATTEKGRRFLGGFGI